jgi:hypothetical protein
VVFANFTTFFGTGITNANVTWVVGTFNGTFLHWQNGIYNATIPTDGLAISTWTVYITASSEDVLQRVQPFTANLEEITTKIDVLGDTIQVYWNESYTISIFYNDTWTGFPNPTYPGISDAEIRFTWAGGSGFLNSTGLVGWYEVDILDFTGVGTATYILTITGKKDGYQFASVDIQVRVLPRLTTVTIVDIDSYRWIDGVRYNTTVNIEDPIWRVPVDDTVVVYVNFTDSEGNIITNATQAQGSLDFLAYGDDFRYDPVLMLWIAELTIPIVGESSLSVSFSLAYHDIPLAGGTLDATLVPLSVVLENENVLGNSFEVNTLLSPRQYELELNISDSWHGIGLRGFTLDNITIDSLSIPGLQILWETWREGTDPGIYYLTVLCTSPGSGNLVIEIEANWLRDEQYLQEAYVNFIMNFQFSQTDTIAIFGGITIGVVVAIILIGWSLWARVLSVPWEVRRMRKLIKTIEKDENYKLGKKDLKRFRARSVTMEDKVSTAMATVGVVATPAMIPTIDEVEEITATEEDIMTELDKIPGLGPEEKTILANEMRKIPRKDRIWFLDDLKRQMGQRRMDFLTHREEPPTPEVAPAEAPPEPVPTETPPVKPEVPPLEEVPPAEPPEPKALKEDRTAPTVLPPELQEVPAAPAAVVAEIHRELDKIPGLSDAEKAALVDHLKYLSKEERQATYNSLRQSAEMDE